MQSYCIADVSNNFIYIDGTDAATEGTFVSNVTGRNLTYLPWNGGEPNYWGNEDCLNIYRDSGKWNDIPCDRQLPSVCEIREFVSNLTKLINSVKIKAF